MREYENGLTIVAGAQLGLLTAEQCELLGISPKQIHLKVRRGEWLRLLRGVYKLSPSPPTLDERELALLLRLGTASALSHQSAARRLRIQVPPSPEIQVTIHHDRGRRDFTGARIWRTATLEPSDTFESGPFRSTRTCRTLLDLTAVLDDRWMRAAFDSAIRREPAALRWVRRFLAEDRSGIRGVEKLRELASLYGGQREIPDSVLESFAMELGLGTGRKPVLHFRIGQRGHHIAEVDFAWPDRRLAVELDGWAFHSDRHAFQRDRERDRELQSLGWKVYRFTWAEVETHPRRFVDELTRAYERSRPLERMSPAVPGA